MQRPGGDDLPFLYSGTLVVQGKGLASVIATGAHTEIGRIGRALESVEQPTGVQRETRRVVTRVAWFGVALCIVVVVVYGLTRGDWLQGLLAGITLAMAMLPEEFPVVLTIFLGLGAWRISQQQVLTRRMPGDRDAGRPPCCASDKTGTLTQNRMTRAAACRGIGAASVRVEAPEDSRSRFHEIVEFGILASQLDPFDPMEKAFQAAWRALPGAIRAPPRRLDAGPRVSALGTPAGDVARLAVARDRGDYVIAAKGAPEAIADLCHFDAARAGARAHSRGDGRPGPARARRGAGDLRGIRACRANSTTSSSSSSGLVGLADPVREAVPAAIASATPPASAW